VDRNGKLRTSQHVYIISVIKSKTVRRVGRVERMGEIRNVYIYIFFPIT
jgi:hypothetical protein